MCVLNRRKQCFKNKVKTEMSLWSPVSRETNLDLNDVNKRALFLRLLAFNGIFYEHFKTTLQHVCIELKHLWEHLKNSK